MSPSASEHSSLALLADENRRDYVMDRQGGDGESIRSGGSLGVLVLGSKDQRLTLMDEIILLGLKDQKGYLSFLNDSISYVLRGCIIIELALRRRVRTVREAGAPRRPFADRLIEVVDSTATGEVLLDESLRMMKSQRGSVGAWLDLLSGETWNPLKVGYQLKQVRERVAKGLVDKGVLRTEKHSFLLFDMATHPLVSTATKEDLFKRVIGTCLGRGAVPSLRSIALVAAALTANVLENVLNTLPHVERDAAFSRAEELLQLYASPAEKNVPLPPANEIVAGVLSVFSKLDSLIY